MIAGGVTWAPIAISAVGSLGFGAFVGALAAHFLRERADRIKDERESSALLRLVSLEAGMNGDALHFDSEKERDAKVAQALRQEGNLDLQTDIWEASRLRLAQLLLSEDFDIFYTHFLYMQIARGNLEAAATHQKGEQWTRSILNDYMEREPAFDEAMDAILAKHNVSQFEFPLVDQLDL